MRYLKLIEMPVKDFKTLGKDLNLGGSFDKTDRAILQNTNGVSKIMRMFEKSAFNWRLYFVNSGYFRGRGEIGKISYEDLITAMANAKISSDDFVPNADINVIFVNNTAAQKKQLSGWIIAHRIAHALARNNPLWKNMLNEIAHEYVNVVKWVYWNQDGTFDNYSWNWSDLRSYRQSPQLQLLCDLGTFKSAQERKIRNCFEANYEFFAQYIVSGKITMNPMPDRFMGVISPNDRDDKLTAAQHLCDLYQSHFDRICRDVEGKWLLM